MAENEMEGQLFLMTISVVPSFIKYSELEGRKNSYFCASKYSLFSLTRNNKEHLCIRYFSLSTFYLSLKKLSVTRSFKHKS